MKLVIFVVSLVLTQAIENDKLIEKWAKFQIEYGKTYRSAVEVQKRFNIFKENLENIEAHNILYEKGASSYRKGMNHFADWKPEEFMQYVNNSAYGEPEITGDTFERRYVKIPDSVDWRDSSAVTPVKNQGDCRSSWAFSSVGAIESYQALEKGSLIELSEQQLIDCSLKQGNLGCNGGNVRKAFQYVRKNGIVRDVDYPYTAKNGQCIADLYDSVTKVKMTIKIKKDDEAALEEVLATKGPVSVSLDATTALQFYSGGILNDTQCGSVNAKLGVLTVGYGVENNQQYYIIKNSWGSKWGESGYFRLARNANNKCGIATSANYPIIM